MNTKYALRIKRKKKVRSKITGDATRPRMSVFRSLRGIYVQVIDDVQGKTLVSADSRTCKNKGVSVSSAQELGKVIAQKCAKAGIEQLVFDRSGYRYHGRVKALVDAVRENNIVI